MSFQGLINNKGYKYSHAVIIGFSFCFCLAACSNGTFRANYSSPSGNNQIVYYERDGGIATDFIARLRLVVDGKDRGVIYDQEHVGIESAKWISEDYVIISGAFGLDDPTTKTYSGVTIAFINITTPDLKTELEAKKRHREELLQKRRNSR